MILTMIVLLYVMTLFIIILVTTSDLLTSEYIAMFLLSYLIDIICITSTFTHHLLMSILYNVFGKDDETNNVKEVN